jgi:hypothetical protein
MSTDDRHTSEGSVEPQRKRYGDGPTSSTPKPNVPDERLDKIIGGYLTWYYRPNGLPKMVCMRIGPEPMIRDNVTVVVSEHALTEREMFLVGNGRCDRQMIEEKFPVGP